MKGLMIHLFVELLRTGAAINAALLIAMIVYLPDFTDQAAEPTVVPCAVARVAAAALTGW